MKKILFSAVCMLTALVAWAASAEPNQCLRVTLSSGHVCTLALEPGLCIHLVKEGELYPSKYIVVVNEQQDTLYSMPSVAMLSYSGDFPNPPTGVDQVEEDADLRLQSDGISVSGCPDKTVVSVYSVDGKQYFRAAAQDGRCFIPRNGLPKGVLIIKVNNKAIKLINR